MAAQPGAPVTGKGQQLEDYMRAPWFSNSMGVPGWTHFLDVDEYVPELKWPTSILAFDQMRTDSQISGLMRAMFLPIKRYRYMIDPNGCSPDMTDKLSRGLNLDVVGSEPKPTRRTKNRFSFFQHMTEAFLAPIHGHAYFNWWGQIDPIDGFWYPRKMLYLPPRTISKIAVAPDGGLIGIEQRLANQTGLYGWNPIQIKTHELIAYIWEKEGPNWLGRSLFRDAWKNWLSKDRLLRIDVINHEKAGGIAWVEAPANTTPAERQELAKMASELKVAEDAGAAVPQGGKLNIARAGSPTDVINSIKYHDEAMAKMFLHMFLSLGHTETGSRALGTTFVEYAFIAQKWAAQWFVDIFNEHVIEDWVEWNYGVTAELAPKLVYIIEEEDELLPVADLVAMVGAGLIVVDPELRDYLSHRFKLPAQNTVAPALRVGGAVTEAARRVGQRMYEYSALKNIVSSQHDAGQRAGTRATLRGMFGRRSR